ncbi:uncharacterized protein EV420DRAFT_1769052 [Desarmillaria tabescens]|uniref:DUF4470 domain-containing protein n=1 Tax=Armillaria tabescens TaxID=1929756 RepID=A0AA39JH57_ARMTA|nr:uncharacterized protein EV420DRAFT_1769052 [Desarmillaria tabescens]KAK0441234.1 hypothetical protein EV420DRAFT_1769052 [Desarmillaria tabescens]
MSATTVALKETATQLFREAKFDEAAKKYRQAEEINLRDAVFPSNLSAALYELGDYCGSFEAICRAVQQPDCSSNLHQRLSPRMAKCHIYGTRSGTISSGRIKSEKPGVSAAARLRLVELPKSKPDPHPVLEYFKDPQQDENPLVLSQLALSRISKLAFFFGGCGDARHVFGTLISLHKSFTQLGKNKKKHFRSHLTFLDIHPTTLACDLVLFMFMDDLIASRNSEEEEAEIKATLFYTYFGVLMPSYCHHRFQCVVKRLINGLQATPPIIPAWIHADAGAIPKIVRSLTFWQDGLSGKTVDGMLARHVFGLHTQKVEPNQDLPPEVMTKYGARDLRELKLERAIHIRDVMTDEEVIQLFRGTFAQPAMCKDVEAGTGWVSLNAHREEKWYNKTSVFIPPASLLRRHDGFERIWKTIRDNSSKDSGDGDLFKKVKMDIISSWKPNPSLFDRDIDESGTDYPKMDGNPFEPIRHFEKFGVNSNLLTTVDRNNPAFSVAMFFFDAVVNTLKYMRGRVKLEFLLGDVSQQLAKINFDTDSSRPVDFPKTFTRMWLSNVPDYTHGPLNMALYVVPNNEVSPQATVSANCLLDRGLWPDDDSYCHTYTLLIAEELPKFLGCRVISMSPYTRIVLASRTLPIPLKELASRNELITWLTRILLCIIRPGHTKPTPCLVHYPNNLAVFVDLLLLHLHKVGFPAHWLAYFLGRVLLNNLATDVAPYLGAFPIPPEERTRRVPMRRINLDPWCAELKTILAEGFEALPFPVFLSLPCDIGIFEVSVPTEVYPRSSSPDVMALMFYNPRVSMAEDLLFSIDDILESKRIPPLHILTAALAIDLRRNGVIKWRMSRECVSSMKQEGWVFAVFRTDIYCPAAGPFSASRWMEVSS